MKRPLSQKLRKLFSERMQKEFPEFVSVNNSRGFARIYRRGPERQLYYFIVLDISDKWNSYTIEIGWSKDPDYPQGDYLSVPVALPGAEDDVEEPTGGAARFRLGSLWTTEDVWWNVLTGKDKCKDREFSFRSGGTREEPPDPNGDHVVECLARTFGAMHEHIPPYFERVARDYGSG